MSPGGLFFPHLDWPARQFRGKLPEDRPSPGRGCSMRLLALLIVAMPFVAGSSGCQTCGDRPRLIDRLFHRDRDDCPSKSRRDGASAVKPCADVATRGGCANSMGAPMVPSGYGQLHSTPVSSTMPIYSSAPFTAYPSAVGPSFNAPPRDNELPMPGQGGGQRMPPMDVPTGPLAPTTPANPNVSAPPFSSPGRFTGDARQ